MFQYGIGRRWFYKMWLETEEYERDLKDITRLELLRQTQDTEIIVFG